MSARHGTRAGGAWGFAALVLLALPGALPAQTRTTTSALAPELSVNPVTGRRVVGKLPPMKVPSPLDPATQKTLTTVGSPMRPIAPKATSTFPTGTTLSTSPTVSSAPGGGGGAALMSMAAAKAYDFDGDGKADLLWRSANSGENAIWLMNGTTLLSSSLILPVADSAWRIVGVGDFNGDGKADILWRNTDTGENAIWLMNGFTLTASALIPSVSTAGWTIAGVGDFNGDGKSDILWQNSTTRENALWLMNGFNFLATALIPSVPDAAWTIAGVGDFNADGKSDILLRNTSSGENAVWLLDGSPIETGNPATVVGGNLLVVADLNYHIAGVGDFNGDGIADILWVYFDPATGATANTVWGWLLSGVVTNGVMNLAASGGYGGVPRDWRVLQVADLDGNGTADLVWRQPGTEGANAVWLIAGLNVSGSSLVPGISSLHWNLRPGATPDRSGPVATNLAPASGTLPPSTTGALTITGQTNDAGSYHRALRGNADGTGQLLSATGAGVTVSLPVTLTEGSNRFSLTLLDRSGNISLPPALDYAFSAQLSIGISTPTNNSSTTDDMSRIVGLYTAPATGTVTVMNPPCPPTSPTAPPSLGAPLSAGSFSPPAPTRSPPPCRTRAARPLRSQPTSR